MLEPIVTSLHFSCHSRWGVQPSSARVRELVREFLDWMRESKEWTELETEWKSLEEGPWSLPLALSRAYVRFRETQTRPAKGRSESGARTLLELPSPHHGQAGVLSDAIMDAFSSLAQQLPYELKAVYLLYLEGLLPSEISALAQISPSEVERRIRESKERLGGSLGRTGT